MSNFDVQLFATIVFLALFIVYFVDILKKSSIKKLLVNFGILPVLALLISLYSPFSAIRVLFVLFTSVLVYIWSGLFFIAVLLYLQKKYPTEFATVQDATGKTLQFIGASLRNHFRSHDK